MGLLSQDFVKQMELELNNNQNKGNWLEWHPSEEQALSELVYHIKKLEKALLLKDPKLIREFSADVANISEKIFTEFGEQPHHKG